MKSAQFGTICLIFTLFAPLARAQTPPVAVEDLLRRGVELRRGGRIEEALVQFEAAYAQQRDPRTSAQLGLGYQAAGRWLRADALLREAMGHPDDGWIARNQAALDGAMAVVSRHLATVDLVGGVPGSRVRVDGEDVGVLPLAAPLRVLAGSVALEVSAEGYEPLAMRFVAAAGESLRERVTMVPVRPIAPPAVVVPVVAPPAVVVPVVAPPAVVPVVAPPAVVAPPRAPWTALAVASFAGAGVLLATGVAAALVREDAAGDYNTQCDAGDARGQCGAFRDRSASAGAVAWTTLPLSALMAAAGLFFVVRDGGASAHASRVSSCGAGPTSIHCAVVF